MPLMFLLAWLGITILWWGLALAPLPSTPPAWLLLARQVCFGATDTGLPAGYGWLGLFAVPGSMLGLLLVVWGKELQRQMHSLRHTWRGTLLLGCLVLLPVCGTLWVGQRLLTTLQAQKALTQPPPATPFPEDWPRLDRPAAAFSLLDQHGNATALTDQGGKIILLTFAFGHCETVCPTIVQTARAALSATAHLEAQLWVVTLDPWRDTPGALPGLAQHWQLSGKNMRLLSGPVPTVLAVLEAYNVPYQRNAQTGDVSHPALVYVIDAAGHLAYALANPSQRWLTEAMHRLAHREASTTLPAAPPSDGALRPPDSRAVRQQ